jgi:glyoxylase-like metal-dependent hydrolase (beta-lactamase superfamily II)
MSVSFDVISIGCLSRHRLWDENQPVRASHATVTLVRDGATSILVDPSLPAQVLEKLLFDRSGLKPDRIDVVFLTCFRPVHRRGLDLFPEADVLMGEQEIESVSRHLDETEQHNPQDSEIQLLIGSEREILNRIKKAPDRLTPQVHLFPTPGASAGSCSLLLVPPTRTVAVAGDAVLTGAHFDAGMVFEKSFDADTAKESLRELVEIADCYVPGHDNIILPRG